MNSSHNANKLVARSTDDPENPDNSGSGEDDEVDDGRNRVTIHETGRSLYHEIDLAASFLSHQETSSSSVATTGKPWWVQSSKDSLNPTMRPMKTGENRHLRK